MSSKISKAFSTVASVLPVPGGPKRIWFIGYLLSFLSPPLCVGLPVLPSNIFGGMFLFIISFTIFSCLVFPVPTNSFSKAENLGYPINSVGNDIFFILSVDGQRGYYSSIKEESIGGNDIYEIDTRFGDNDLKVKHGIAYKDGVPSKVKITLLDNEGNIVNGTYNSNPKTGKFILVMNPLKSYKAIIESDGFTTLVVDIAPLAIEKVDNDLEFRILKK